VTTEPNVHDVPHSLTLDGAKQKLPAAEAGTNPASGRGATGRGVKLFRQLGTSITYSAVSDLRSKKEAFGAEN
jgi:hypothetical protein